MLRVAVREWRKRPAPGADPPMPKWMNALVTFTPASAAIKSVIVVIIGVKLIGDAISGLRA